MSQPSRSTEHPDSQGTAPSGEKLSPYEVMLQSALPDYLTNPEGAIHDLPPENPVYYFFYGTLTAPQTLQRIIDLPAEPELRKAKVIGYALAKWGDYPALIDREQGQQIVGHAYLVQSEEEAQKLAYYETNTYKVAPCRIFFTDNGKPSEARGKTFIYAGDPECLLEQRFDRKLWAHQTGGRLF